MKTIATYGKLQDAFMARARLEASGVEAFIPDELSASSGWAVLPGFEGIRLQVNEADFARATQVLGEPPVR